MVWFPSLPPLNKTISVFLFPPFFFDSKILIMSRKTKGGGYTCPADPGHFEFASTIVDSAKSAGKDVAVLFPAYGLAPYDTWPKQLEHGVESLKYVLEELGRKPGNVMLGGDSAGASSLSTSPSCINLPLSFELRILFHLSPKCSLDCRSKPRSRGPLPHPPPSSLRHRPSHHLSTPQRCHLHGPLVVLRYRLAMRRCEHEQR